MQGVGRAISLQLALRRRGRESAVGRREAEVGEREAAVHVGLVVAQIHHETVVDLQFIRHGVIQRAQQDVAEAELAQPGENGQLVSERLTHACANGVFPQGQVDQIRLDVAEPVYFFLCPRQNGMGLVNVSGERGMVIPD